MAFRVRDALVTNWPIKLTSLALAAVLWAAVAAEQPTTLLVPVQLMVEPPGGRALTRPLPPVKALFAGSARELIKLYAKPPFISQVIPDTVAGATYVLDLTPDDVKLSERAEVRALDIQPGRIEIALDAVTGRLVPVLPRVTIRPEAGFAIVGGIALSPSSLVVRGPDAVVARIPSVSTVPLEITAVRGPVRRTVPIDTAGMGMAQPSRREVEVAAEIEAMSERSLLAVPVEVRGDHGSWSIEPGSVLVTVRGPTPRIAQLTRDSVAVVAFPTAGGRRESVRLNVLTPRGIEASVTPDSVQIQRRGNG